MPKSKKNAEEPQTVQQKLEHLLELQGIMTQIDKLKGLRGELPEEVKGLKDKVEGLEKRLQKYNDEAKELNQYITAQKAKVTSAKELMEKYQVQMDSVHNNREYENLSKEMEYQTLTASLAEKRAKESSAKLQLKKTDIAGVKEELKAAQDTLAQKAANLDKLVAETRQEETQLREQAELCERKIEQRLLNSFKRIRKNANNGQAIVPVTRASCGGCFNNIPLQRQLEIKMQQKIVFCEYCGRILVDDSQSEETEEAQAEN